MTATTAAASDAAKAAVFVQSEAYEGTRINGPDFNNRHSLEQLLKSYETIGFQANGLARAIELIDKMVSHPRELSLSLESRVRTPP